MSDREQIQGTWQLVSGERNGKPISEDVAKQVRLVFEGCKLLTKSKDRVTEGKFRLNAEVKPAEIDLEMDGQLGEGIYSLDGDNLKVVHGEVGDPRPTEFIPDPGSGLTLLVLKRGQP
jgi:uncharacterized protein (TIGR03067 family)